MGSSVPSESGLLALRQLITLCVFPVMSGGLAGYFLCFWPSKKPASRIVLAVCLPSVVGFSLVVWKTFDVFNQPTSILYRRRMSTGVPSWFHLNLLNFPTGLLICAGGVLLILVFVVLLFRGASSLPLALSTGEARTEEKPEMWSRVRLLNFVLMGPYFLLLGLLGFLILGLPYIFLHTLSPKIAGNLANVAGVLGAVLLNCTAAFILGGQSISLLRDSLRLPGLLSLSQPRCQSLFAA